MSNDQSNPWKTVSSRVVYKNPWITVREDQVITPGGRPGIYGVVEPKVAVGIVALTQQNEIYLVGQYRYAMQEYSWEIIEGGVEPGEDRLLAAKRELQEEAGLIASEFISIGGEMHLSNCFTSERAYSYLARGLSHVPNAPDTTEQLALKKIPFNECLAMIDRNEIRDSLTIISVFHAQRLLGL